MRAEIDPALASGQLACPNGDWSHSFSPGSIENGTPRCCLACGCSDLWRQKDFPQGLGFLLVALGALFSTIAWAYMRPLLAIGILMVFALADLLLYTLMKDVLVCYRCRATHRRANLDEEHPRFNLELAERYRQESIRLEDSRRG
jgi:hypothetical protein